MAYIDGQTDLFKEKVAVSKDAAHLVKVVRKVEVVAEIKLPENEGHQLFMRSTKLNTTLQVECRRYDITCCAGYRAGLSITARDVPSPFVPSSRLFETRAEMILLAIL